MPAAPATQPRPKIGVRFTRAGSRRRFISRASIDGVAMPVTVTKNSASMSSGVNPALAIAARTASAPTSSATRIQASFAWPHVASRSYSSIGSARWRPPTRTFRCSASRRSTLK